MHKIVRNQTRLEYFYHIDSTFNQVYQVSSSFYSLIYLVSDMTEFSYCSPICTAHECSGNKYKSKDLHSYDYGGNFSDMLEIRPTPLVPICNKGDTKNSIEQHSGSSLPDFILLESPRSLI